MAVQCRHYALLLPTAKILSQDEEGWLVSAEVFGTGIDMWLKSQGGYVAIV